MAQTESEKEPDDVLSLFDQPMGTDWFLANLIHMADTYKIEQGVTLNVGGVLITGQLISSRSYFQEIAEFTKMSTQGTASQDLGQLLGAAHQQWAEFFPERKEGEDYVYRLKNYVHLRNAIIFGSNGSMSGNKGVLWRGKLSAVDGFFFGNLQID